MAIEVTFDNKEYYLFMATARYGDRGYNVATNPLMGNAYGIKIDAGGLIEK